MYWIEAEKIWNKEISMTQSKEQFNLKDSRQSQIDAYEKSEKNKAEQLESEPLRLGRRESEPHSAEVSYLFEVFSSNFPKHRTIWDLHHYFEIGGKRVDIQFDISFFLDFALPEDLPSYTAADFNKRIPDLVINVLSKSTWEKDLSKIQELCRRLSIPTYIVFLSYPIVPTVFSTPFLRVYNLEEDGLYSMHELNSFMYDQTILVDSAAQIQLRDVFPFSLALQKLSRTYLGQKVRSRLILLKKGTNERYLVKHEIEKLRADEQAKRADVQTKRADEQTKRAEDAEKKVKELERLLNKK